MKAIFSLLFMTILVQLARGQKGHIPSAFIDREVKAYETSTPALLVKEVTAPYQSDRQKITSIFRWITDNISYNIRAAGRNRNIPAIFEEPDDDTGTVLKPLNLRVAETVLRRRMAVCDGYARLFKTMCDHANIPSEVVTGYARTGWNRRRSNFGSNHTWNAVYIDSAWYLLDATWAAGHTNLRGDEYIRFYDARYFLTDPVQFILDHYPEDIRWTLLKEPPPLTEFNYSPFRYKGFIKTGIHSFYPARGVIEATVGDSIRFEVNSSVMQGLLEVVSGDQPEDSIGNDDDPVIIGGRRKAFTYTVTPETGEWLYVICNGYVVLRYKLIIRKPGDKEGTLSRQ
ncbi:MAG: hypothetical protein JNK14_14760 [Chitinophagaceae bacterium]|nr:hypothetical protein [Chitinophagaceae bacterium]